MDMFLLSFSEFCDCSMVLQFSFSSSFLIFDFMFWCSFAHSLVLLSRIFLFFSWSFLGNFYVSSGAFRFVSSILVFEFILNFCCSESFLPCTPPPFQWKEVPSLSFVEHRSAMCFSMVFTIVASSLLHKLLVFPCAVPLVHLSCIWRNTLVLCVVRAIILRTFSANPSAIAFLSAYSPSIPPPFSPALLRI
jgi:hypothetical protein